jgi:hypothetical protein
MMMKFHSCRASKLVGSSMSFRQGASWKSQLKKGNENRLQVSLIMFLDLGLTPYEMSSVSGFSLNEIEKGLAQLDRADDWPSRGRQPAAKEQQICS